MGQVVNPVTKDDAQKAVKSIEGVGQINNQIEVLPVSPFDNDIRRAEYRAIYSFPSLEKYATDGAALDPHRREKWLRHLSMASY